MLLHLEQPYAAILVCTGDTHAEPVILGFPESKKKDALTPEQVGIALEAIAEEDGWLVGANADFYNGKIGGCCPRCGIESAKFGLAAAQNAYETGGTDDELDELTTAIAACEMYLARFDPDRKKQQQELPLDEAEAPVAGEDAETSTEPPPDE